MKKVLASIGLVGALVALAPIDGEAGGPSRGPRSRGYSSHSTRAYPYPYYYRPYYWPFAYRPYYYYPSLSYYAPPAYVVPAPGTYYSTPPGSYGMAPAPQIEREVVFPEGRYVLLGDGEAVPFRWVWVPNPPAAPPADTQD